MSAAQHKARPRPAGAREDEIALVQLTDAFRAAASCVDAWRRDPREAARAIDQAEDSASDALARFVTGRLGDAAGDEAWPYLDGLIPFVQAEFELGVSAGFYLAFYDAFFGGEIYAMRKYRANEAEAELREFRLRVQDVTIINDVANAIGEAKIEKELLKYAERKAKTRA